jgi:hypothetical protein
MESTASSKSISESRQEVREDLLNRNKRSGDLLESPSILANTEAAWSWRHTPWVSALITVVAGCGGIAVGTLVNMHPYEISWWFRGAFVGLGVVIILSAFFLTKTSLLIGSDRKTLYRVSGPWIGIRSKAYSVPLDSVVSVVHRWRYLTTKQEKSNPIHRLFLQTRDGKEFDIFPVNKLPAFPDRCGRSLAEFLRVDFRLDEDRT